jgi:hypothetical protein
VTDKGLPSCLDVLALPPPPSTKILCQNVQHNRPVCALSPSWIRCLIIFSYPLSNFTFRCVISISFGVFFCVPDKRDSPDLLMRPTVPKRHNLKKIHQSQLAYSASKITMRTLACDAPSRAFSSYMIMVIPTSLCSRLPTLSSSCMFSQFSAFSFI